MVIQQVCVTCLLCTRKWGRPRDSMKSGATSAFAKPPPGDRLGRSWRRAVSQAESAYARPQWSREWGRSLRGRIRRSLPEELELKFTGWLGASQAKKGWVTLWAPRKARHDLRGSERIWGWWEQLENTAWHIGREPMAYIILGFGDVERTLIFIS